MLRGFRFPNNGVISSAVLKNLAQADIIPEIVSDDSGRILFVPDNSTAVAIATRYLGQPICSKAELHDKKQQFNKLRSLVSRILSWIGR